MLRTDPAILRGNLLDWGDNPPQLTVGEVRVYVTILDSPAPAPNGPAMVAALEALAAAGGPSGFDDPEGWEREIREDRPLPGRGC